MIHRWCLLPQVWAAEQAPGAAPVIAEIAKEKGILTVGIVTKPFVLRVRYVCSRQRQVLQSLQAM